MRKIALTMINEAATGLIVTAADGSELNAKELESLAKYKGHQHPMSEKERLYKVSTPNHSTVELKTILIAARDCDVDYSITGKELQLHVDTEQMKSAGIRLKHLEKLEAEQAA